MASLQLGPPAKQNSTSMESTFRTFSNRFLKKTSIQFLDNICSKDSRGASRVFYLLVLLLLISLSSYYTVELYTKWTNRPILLTDSSKEMSITSLPFPAVTICNLNLAKRSVAEKIERYTWDFVRLKTICKEQIDLNWANATNATEWEAFREFINRVTQPCDEMILTCRYGSIFQNCSEIFETVITDQGVCCKFNSLHPDFIFQNNRSDQITYRNLSLHTPVRFIPETGYEDVLPEDYYPRKVQGMGVPMGLTLVLNASLNEYYCSSSRSFGFKIRLHIPSDTPRVADYAKLVPTKYETRVLITPSYRDTAQAVRSLPVTARNCLYNSESDLEYFQIYSSNSCELECTSKIMEEECGCVQTYLPRSSNKTITCGLKDFICSQRVEKELSGLVNPRRKCKDCLWSCSFIDFDETISRSRLMENAPMLNEVLPGGYNVSELAVVHFYYNQKTMRVTRMEAYLGFLDFFSNSGGIYSLFLGFSILSLIELFYFATLFAMKIIRWRRQNRKIEHNMSNLPKIIYCTSRNEITGRKSIHSY